ncbi:MAG: UDP-N-acetylmuramoyl-L-alanine--D-glutamate ligase [Proteobacteria bacterium]|nr:UDP-N-acetylmuramoyl-L-alanine--D-glutamate ligase [Pseudomonadota bacterium]
MMELTNKKILVVGLGKSGVSVARFLKELGALVTVTDTKSKESLGSIADDLQGAGIATVFGTHHDDTFKDKDLIVLSPGVSHTIPPVKKAVSNQIPVVGEIELASWFIREPIIAVTGTNGKTTTTTLVSDMLTCSGKTVFTGGNIGTPLIDYLRHKEKKDLLVVEVSSFQLDTIQTFRPSVSILLNITDDHLDRYDNFNGYAASKIRIFENQEESDTAVIYGDDPKIRALTKDIKCKSLFFGGAKDLPFHAVIETGQIRINTPILSFSLDIETLPLFGGHNFENIAASTLAAMAAGATEEGIRSALSQFKGLPHRIEYVDKLNGISFYDDSKATNVDAVLRALEAFTCPVSLIMGGRDKGGNFSLLKDHVKKHVKKIIVIGEAAPVIKDALSDVSDILKARNMEEAVILAHQNASPGEAVLLSPACASFDMYNSYAERGNDFRMAVSKLKVKK